MGTVRDRLGAVGASKEADEGLLGLVGVPRLWGGSFATLDSSPPSSILQLSQPGYITVIGGGGLKAAISNPLDKKYHELNP